MKELSKEQQIREAASGCNAEFVTYVLGYSIETLKEVLEERRERLRNAIKEMMKQKLYNRFEGTRIKFSEIYSSFDMSIPLKSFRDGITKKSIKDEHLLEFVEKVNQDRSIMNENNEIIEMDPERNYFSN